MHITHTHRIKWVFERKFHFPPKEFSSYYHIWKEKQRAKKSCQIENNNSTKAIMNSIKTESSHNYKYGFWRSCSGSGSTTVFICSVPRWDVKMSSILSCWPCTHQGWACVLGLQSPACPPDTCLLSPLSFACGRWRNSGLGQWNNLLIQAGSKWAAEQEFRPKLTWLGSTSF